MADEATVYSSLQISSGNLQYRSAQSAFRATVTGVFGPTPGCIEVTTDGTDIDLSELTTPGLCEITNLDTTNWVVLGRWDQTNSRFYPFMDVGPGHTYVIMLAQDVEEEYPGTGTGTSGIVSTLRAKAQNAPVSLVVRAFER